MIGSDITSDTEREWPFLAHSFIERYLKSACKGEHILQLASEYTEKELPSKMMLPNHSFFSNVGVTIQTLRDRSLKHIKSRLYLFSMQQKLESTAKSNQSSYITQYTKLTQNGYG